MLVQNRTFAADCPGGQSLQKLVYARFSPSVTFGDTSLVRGRRGSVRTGWVAVRRTTVYRAAGITVVHRKINWLRFDEINKTNSVGTDVHDGPLVSQSNFSLPVGGRRGVERTGWVAGRRTTVYRAAEIAVVLSNYCKITR